MISPLRNTAAVCPFQSISNDRKRHFFASFALAELFLPALGFYRLNNCININMLWKSSDATVGSQIGHLVALSLACSGTIKFLKEI